MKEYLTALLLMRVPRSSYAHWMTCSFRARTLSIPVMVAVCSVLATTVYTAPGKALIRTSPLSTVPLCIHSGDVPVSLCLQMRVSWSEQFLPWSSRETEKAAVRCRTRYMQTNVSIQYTNDPSLYICIMYSACIMYCMYRVYIQYYASS